MKKRLPFLLFLGLLMGFLFMFQKPLLRLIPFRFLKTYPDEHIISNLPEKFAKELKSQPQEVLIKNANIIPMDRDTILYQHSLRINEGRITDIYDEWGDGEDTSGIKIIDGTGKYLLPGLADMHSHINDDNNLLLMIAYGVMYTRNMAGYPFHLDLKERLEKGEILGPQLFTTGPILEGPQQIWRNNPGSLRLQSAAEAAEAVRTIHEQGYDFIKVYHTLDPSYYRSILSAAEAIDMKVMGHLPLDLGLAESLGGSQYSIEHIDLGQFKLISPNLSLSKKMQMLGRSGKWFCPTLIVFKKMRAKIGEPGLEREQEYFVDLQTRSFWRRRLSGQPNEYDRRQQLVKEAFDHGAKVLTGTDCINAYVLPGISLHEELEELVACGLRPYEALETSTRHAAEFFGTLQETGSIGIGKKANMILLAKNPLETITHTQSIESVMVEGKWIDQKMRHRILAEIRAFYQK